MAEGWRGFQAGAKDHGIIPPDDKRRGLHANLSQEDIERMEKPWGI
jgi:hypothetical protein